MRLGLTIVPNEPINTPRFFAVSQGYQHGRRNDLPTAYLFSQLSDTKTCLADCNHLLSTVFNPSTRLTLSLMSGLFGNFDAHVTK